MRLKLLNKHSFNDFVIKIYNPVKRIEYRLNNVVDVADHRSVQENIDSNRERAVVQKQEFVLFRNAFPSRSLNLRLPSFP